MARYLNNNKNQRRYLGTVKLKHRYLNGNQLWSSGSLVSYYDGETLLTQKEIDEGLDVLHVSISSKSLIPYPYSNSSKTSNGIVWTVTNDGYITATGTATTDSWFDVISNNKNYFLPSGNYRITGCPTGGDSTKYGIWVTHGASLTNYVREYGEGENFTITSATANETFRVVIGIRQGQTVNNLTFKPMVVNASVYPDTEYDDFVKYGMYKEGYTHFGWSLSNGEERVTELVSTGEPMSLYALFVPNEFVVFTSAVSNWSFSSASWHWNYGETITEEGHISGTKSTSVQAHWSTQAGPTVTFTTSKGDMYGTLTVKAKADSPEGGSAWLVLDGTSSNLTRVLEDGTHTLQAYCSSDGDWHNACVAHIESITLSDPTQWV